MSKDGWEVGKPRQELANEKEMSKRRNGEIFDGEIYYSRAWK